MAVQFIPVTTDEQIQLLAVMANNVWHEWFPSILSEEQIDYMVDRFQSYGAIRKQITEGYEYFFIYVGQMPVGYVGIHEEKPEKKLFVSKVYLMKEFRGKGYASEAFAFLEGLCSGMGLTSMYLTVNKYNSHAILVYQKKGFETVRAQVTDIGNGFVMDDYVMEKKLEVK